MQLGVLVPVLLSGALVDRFNRRTVMVVCDGARALLLAALAAASLLHDVTLAQLLVTALLTGFFGSLFYPADSAALRRVVPEDRLAEAMSKAQARDCAADLTGTPLGGVAFGVCAFLPFLADAVSYLGSLVSLLFLRTPQRIAPPAERNGVWSDVRAGLCWTWGHRFIRIAALRSLIVNLSFPFLYYSIIFVGRAHGATAAQIGLAFMSGTVAGLLGSLAAPRFTASGAVRLLMAGSCWIIALVLLGMMFSTNVFVLGALYAIVMLTSPVAEIVVSAKVTAATPDEMHGRTQSVLFLIANATAPLGAVLMGALTGSLGSRTTLLIGVVLMVLGALVLSTSRTVREMASADVPGSAAGTKAAAVDRGAGAA